MSTFHTAHGTVRYSGIRRYIVVARGTTVKRTDSLATAQKTAADQGGASIVDTSVRPIAENESRVCRVCKSAALVQVDDFAEFGAHWGCLTTHEREIISSAHRVEAMKEEGLQTRGSVRQSYP